MLKTKSYHSSGSKTFRSWWQLITSSITKGWCTFCCISMKEMQTNYNNMQYKSNMTAVVYLINRFQVAVRLFSNRWQRTSKCGKNKKVAHEAQMSVSLTFLPHFDVLCDLLLNRCMATWNLLVLYNKELKKVLMMTSSICLSSNRS